MNTIIPKGYRNILGMYDTQKAISLIHRLFPAQCRAMRKKLQYAGLNVSPEFIYQTRVFLMFLLGALVERLSISAPGMATFVKVAVDTLLFFISYFIHKKWVFREP